MNLFRDIEKEHRIKLLFYLFISFAMIALPFATGMLKGSTPRAILLVVGAVFFFYALPYYWGNAKFYVIEFAVLFVIYLLIWLFASKLTYWQEIKTHGRMEEDVAWFLGEVVMVAFIGVTAGIFVFSEGQRYLLYQASVFILAGVFIMFPQILTSSLTKQSVLFTAWVFLGLQLALMAAILYIASFNKTKSRLSRMILSIAAIILMAMAIWGFFINNETHWMAGLRFWAILETASGFMVFYALAGNSDVLNSDTGDA